jgi:hypothetical protein
VDAGDLVAGIDDDSLARLLVPHEGAIASEKAYREGFEDHVLIVGGRQGPRKQGTE